MTRLKSIRISHFRGFYEPESIIVAIPNGKAGSGLTVIVGPNNSGKTTVLEAVKKFFTGNPPQFDKEERHIDKDVLIELINSDDKIKTVSTNKSSIGILGNAELYPGKTDFFLISSRRYFETYFSTDQFNHAQNRDTSFTITKSGSDGVFGRRMINIAQEAAVKEKFDAILKMLIPHFNSWNIELSRGQNYIRYVTGNNDEHSSELFGDGVISLFKIAAALVTGEDSEILVVDEPELSLHPQAQKALSKVLREYSKNKQILLTTHSPIFINWKDVENGAEINRLNKVGDKKCTVGTLSAEVKKDLLKYTDDWRKPQLLDTVAKEIFFSEKMVFVEGLEDMSLITRFIEEQGIEINFEIFGYGSGGAANIQTLLQMSEDLGLRAGAIFDGKEKKLIAEAEKVFPKSLIKWISTDDIRDKKEKGINGLFTESGELKPENEAELKEIIKEFNAYFEA